MHVCAPCIDLRKDQQEKFRDCLSGAAQDNTRHDKLIWETKQMMCHRSIKRIRRVCGSAAARK